MLIEAVFAGFGASGRNAGLFGARSRDRDDAHLDLIFGCRQIRDTDARRGGEMIAVVEKLGARGHDLLSLRAHRRLPLNGPSGTPANDRVRLQMPGFLLKQEAMLREAALRRYRERNCRRGRPSSQGAHSDAQGDARSGKGRR
ncbi:hypothetical protein [Sphingopyxis indica]|uniref:hypothetical protein n=1 Tax=Sphingopyxis indica TaxID=436663 RepID=UPI00293908D2|nr:hypothetical protein [Sphingopyxis indica]